MKFSKFLMLAGLTAFMASCSSDEPLVVDSPNGIPEQVANSESFMYIGFSMPSQSGRAATPADETKTVASEYSVANASILIFKDGDTEDDATFVRRIPFGSTWDTDNDRKDISKISKVVLTIPANTFEPGKKYSALIVLNAHASYPWPTTGDSFHNWANGTSFDKNVPTRIDVGDEKFMTMVSAPKYQKDTEGGIITLTPLDTEKIKTKESELDKDDPAAEFFVNRIAAKVTVVSDMENRAYEIDTDQAKGTIQLVGWAADIKANVCFPIQNVHSDEIPWYNKDFGYLHGPSGDFTSFPRCYWAFTPSYNTPLETEAERKEVFTYITSVPTTWNTIGEYIKPNCMNYMYQLKNRTTRVVIRATFKRDGETSAQSVYKLGTLGKIMTLEELKAAIASKATVLVGSATVEAAGVELNEAVVNGGYYAFKGTETTKNLIKSITTKADVNAGISARELSSDEYTAVALQLGLSSVSAEEISFYNGGTCYYAVLIRHFTSDDGVAVAPSFADDKPENNYQLKHLGRYGILRNNWYEINVNTVANIGSPKIPDPTPDPDDKEDEKQLMNITINMLNWAKRTQNTDL